MDKPSDPTLEALAELLKEAVMDAITAIQIGKVTGYDEATQRASVRAIISKSHRGENGERVPQVQPEIHSAVVFFIGSRAARITGPVAVGDVCILLHASASIVRWLQTGLDNQDPGDDRRHQTSDCIALIGGHSFNNPPTTAPGNALVLHVGDGIKVKVGGPDGTEPTFMADTFLDAFGDLIDEIATATGTGSGVVTAAKAAFYARVSEFKTSKTEVK